MDGGQDDLIRHRVAMLYGNALPGAVMSVVAGAILCAAYWATASHIFLVGWVGALLLLLAVRAGLTLAYRRRDISDRQAMRWAWAATLSVGFAGLAWGLAGLVLVRTGSADAALLYCCLALGAILTVSGYITWWPAHVAFHGPIFLLTGTGFLLTGRPMAQWLGLACFALFIACAMVGRRLSHIFCQIVDISARNERLATALAQQAETLESANARLRQLSETDFLTGLWNRRRMMAALADETGGHAVILADVDHFKAFNDAFGHAAGDQCLQAVAHVLSAMALRHGGRAARHGGEEFLLLLPGVAHHAAIGIAEEIRLAVEHLYDAPDSELARGVTISLGLAVTQGHIAPSLRLEAADRALYMAKGAGRNRVMLATEPTPVARRSA